MEKITAMKLLVLVFLLYSAYTMDTIVKSQEESVGTKQIAKYHRNWSLLVAGAILLSFLLNKNIQIK